MVGHSMCLPDLGESRWHAGTDAISSWSGMPFECMSISTCGRMSYAYKDVFQNSYALLHAALPMHAEGDTADGGAAFRSCGRRRGSMGRGSRGSALPIV